jgi:hypothetical protein
MYSNIRLLYCFNIFYSIFHTTFLPEEMFDDWFTQFTMFCYTNVSDGSRPKIHRLCFTPVFPVSEMSMSYCNLQRISHRVRSPLRGPFFGSSWFMFCVRRTTHKLLVSSVEIIFILRDLNGEKKPHDYKLYKFDGQHN